MGRKWNTLCFKVPIQKCCERALAPVYRNKIDSWEIWGRRCCSNRLAKHVWGWGAGSPPGHRTQRELQAPRARRGSPAIMAAACVGTRGIAKHQQAVAPEAGGGQPGMKLVGGVCLHKDLGGVGFASAWLALPVTRGTLDVSRCVYVFGSYNENEIPRVALCHFARQTESIYARCGY